MPTFEDFDWITLQPNSAEVPYRFGFAACSSATANDGAIPYGDTVSDCVVTAHDEDGNNVDDLINGDASVNSDNVIVKLDYPSNGAGVYHLSFKITTTNGMVDDWDYNRIRAEDK